MHSTSATAADLGCRNCQGYSGPYIIVRHRSSSYTGTGDDFDKRIVCNTCGRTVSKTYYTSTSIIITPTGPPKKEEQKHRIQPRVPAKPKMKLGKTKRLRDQMMRQTASHVPSKWLQRKHTR